MFSYQHNIPKQHYRVETYPQLADMAKYIEQAHKIKAVKHCFYWVNEKSVQFTLTLLIRKAHEDMQWWMHESSSEIIGGERMLWFYRTNDVGLIYPQILQAVGAPDPSKDGPEQLSGSILDALGGSMQHSAQSKYVSPGSTIATAQPQTNRPPLTKLLSGSLETIPITSILQTAQKEDATGRLVIESQEGEGSVVFMHGRPVHATTPSQSGMEAILELSTWMQGKVSFTQGTKSDTTTISQTVDQILYLAAELIDNIGFLQEHNIDDMSVLTRATNAISEQAFEKRILDGPPLGLELQKKFFQNLDGNRTLKDISILLSLSSSQWIAIATNLLKLGLALTPDGRNVMHDPYASAPPLSPSQSISGTFTTQTQQVAQAGQPQGQFGRSQDHQAQTFDRMKQQQFQAISGNFPQSQSGQFPLNPQTTSGTFQVKQPQQGAGWGNTAQPAAAQAAPLLPPSAMFGAGASAASNDPNLPSPAVQAFLSSTTTIQDADTVHIGLVTTEVFYNRSTPKAVMSALTDPETGILTFEALQFFLEREFARSFRFGTTFSFMVFCMKLRSTERPTISSSKIVNLTTSAISKIKHDVDIFGHFGEKGYGLILPNANSGVAATLVDKITTSLTKFSPELAQTRPAFFFGIANVPSDAKDIETLVANAQKAMQEAIRKNVTRVMFSDIAR